MGVGLQAGFLGQDHERLFVVRWSPQRASKRCVLVVPPLADEMNKSRHLLAQAARGLADQGWHVILPDLYGTGDSDGEFGDASWSRWKRDLGEIIDSVRAEGLEVGALIGVRTGALLAMAVAATHGLDATRAILWQPVIDGARYLAQLLRLRVAASLGGGPTETASELRDRLLGGEPLEIGGYRIAASLARELDQEKLEPLVASFRGHLTWLEIVADSGDALTPASTQFIDRAKLQGVRVMPVAIGGEPYWASAELVRNPELVGRTVAALAVPS